MAPMDRAKLSNVVAASAFVAIALVLGFLMSPLADWLKDRIAAAPERADATTESRDAARPEPLPADPNETELPKLGDYVWVEELPEPMTRVQPIYPEDARRANVEGTVMIQALVGTDGKIKDTKVTQSVRMLDASARTAVSQWVFRPALAHGKPVAVWVAVPVRFNLEP